MGMLVKELEKEQLGLANLKEVRLQNLLLHAIALKTLHVHSSYKRYIEELQNCIKYLEDSATTHSTYQIFCELRHEMLTNLGIAIKDLEAKIRSKERHLIANLEKSQAKLLLKTAKKFFNRMVAIRD
jgi:hypothetical protein